MRGNVGRIRPILGVPHPERRRIGSPNRHRDRVSGRIPCRSARREPRPVRSSGTPIRDFFFDDPETCGSSRGRDTPRPTGSAPPHPPGPPGRSGVSRNDPWGGDTPAAGILSHVPPGRRLACREPAERRRRRNPARKSTPSRTSAARLERGPTRLARRAGACRRAAATPAVPANPGSTDQSRPPASGRLSTPRRNPVRGYGPSGLRRPAPKAATRLEITIGPNFRRSLIDFLRATRLAPPEPGRDGARPSRKGSSVGASSVPPAELLAEARLIPRRSRSTSLD